MKQILLKLFKNIILQIVSLFIIGGVVVFALSSWPSTPPTGETSGGVFMDYFNKLKTKCNAGEVLVGYDSSFNKICVPLGSGPQGPKGDPGTPGTPGPAGPQGPAGNLSNAVFECYNRFKTYTGPEGTLSCNPGDFMVTSFCNIHAAGGSANSITTDSVTCRQASYGSVFGGEISMRCCGIK